jgi:CMP-N-acetylneuraminic acid synthetase
MISNKRVIAIIPARGGSKGLPGKNIRPIGGKPLIAWSIEQARQSRYVDAVVVTTDSQDIADVALGCGAEVPFLRPEHLASDTASSVDTVLHALDYYRDTLGQTFDYVVLLEPTSPLREPDDIDNMLVKLLSHEDEFDAIVSVGEVHEHPSIMKRLEGNTMLPFHADLKMASRRQDNVPAYFPYGVAYIVAAATLYSLRTFYPPRATFFEIKRHQCFEIDDLCDFLVVETVMKQEWNPQ